MSITDTPAKTDRREILMRTAEALFAEKGIDAVSLNEINKAAQQKNTSAIHYHFGNKDGLIQTIVYEHYADIDNKINALLDEYENLKPEKQTPRELIRALVTPFSDQLDSEKGIHYLLIVRQILMKSSDMLLVGHPQGEDRARLRIYGLFRNLMSDVPEQVWPSRLVIGAALIFNSLATYAQTPVNSRGMDATSKDLFVATLLDNLVALYTSPPSPETIKIIEQRK